MIRLFNAFCKANILTYADDAQRYHKSMAGYKHYGERCPKCGAYGGMAAHGHYGRWLVYLDGGRADCSYLRAKRIKCASCRSTHAVLPDVIIPHSPYSLRFMLGVLAAYIKREATVVRICAVYGVAVSTLYRWKGRLLTHKALFLGYLFSKGGPLISFIDGLVRASADLSKRLDGFFRTHGFSFMQNNKGATPQSAPP